MRRRKATMLFASRSLWCMVSMSRIPDVYLREHCGADNMLVLERIQFVSCYGVPYASGEVGRARDAVRGGNVKVGTPYRALVALEGSNPVTALPVPNHGLPICRTHTWRNTREPVHNRDNNLVRSACGYKSAKLTHRHSRRRTILR
jgi:hypothetical protein